MTPEQKEQYIVKVDEQIQTVTKQLKRAEQARNSADSAMTSRYDTQRENFNVEANLHQDSLGDLSAFHELVRCARRSLWIEEGAVFSLHFFDTKEELVDLLYSPINIRLEGIQVITPKSPLGAVLKNKSLMQEFSYTVSGRKVDGIVIKVE